ncbi:hypothetical protein [Streptomyces sp. B6B3]|uniref:hypothetical protein n=1 Tax=Streptomyces sp. B6B3 TaxID=3153570 RepID=UPI00325E6E96
MGRLTSWLTQHMWAQIALMVLVAWTLILIISPDTASAETLYRVAGSAIAVTGIVLVFRRRERRAAGGSARHYATLDHALKRERVPDDPAERRALRNLVAQRLRTTRHHRMALVLLYALFASLVAATLATGDVREIVGFGALSAGFLGWITWYSTHQRRLLKRMHTRLTSDAPAISPGAS